MVNSSSLAFLVTLGALVVVVVVVLATFGPRVLDAINLLPK